MNKSVVFCTALVTACQDVLIRDSKHVAADLSVILADHLRDIIEDRELQVEIKLTYELPILQTSVIQLCLKKCDSATNSPTDLPADEQSEMVYTTSEGVNWDQNTDSGWIIDELAPGASRLRHANAKGSDSLQSVEAVLEEDLVRNLITHVRSIFEVVELSTTEKDLVDVNHRHWFRRL